MTAVRLAVATLAVLLAAPSFAAECVPVSEWVKPGSPGKSLDPTRMMSEMAKKRVVLLGEVHDSAEHHRWQLHTLTALHAMQPDILLGFEMFPRRVQPALDRWVAGELSESEFLAAADWRKVWNLDPSLYMPLFHYARMHRSPMVALDVERSERAGVAPRVAPPSSGYVEILRRTYAEHPGSEFEHFVKSQTQHDRVMAQAIAGALAAHPGALLVGIMGRGHVVHGYGVPRQLNDLGVRDVGMLLPWDRDAGCDAFVAGIADAVFGVAAPADTRVARPRLGVALEPGEGGVRVAAVEKGSIAETSGLRAGDVLLEIAGLPAKSPGDVRDAIERQAPGTWLPLKVRRGGELVDVIAKFPPAVTHTSALHYDIEVRIDPVARTLEGRSTLSVPEARADEISLAPPFVIDERRNEKGRIEIRWHGALEQAAFIRADSGWYPRIPGALASYNLTLDLPAGQVGVVPGKLLEETNEAGRYRARFAFPEPGEGIDVMVSPYRIEERAHKSASGKMLRLRTYFHPEIAALAPGYLDSVAEYIDLYERRIGEYPYDGFSVVSSPTPTGYGMPSLTYLGVDVVKLPFIRATSLGHEVLHNWWGNGVYPDYEHGNWAEGLTTFMADYAYREREGEAAAREMRGSWLRDITAMPENQDEPLVAFRSRTHATSQIVGYRKAAMMFVMLRDELGAQTFEAALREFWRAYRFRVAGWSDLRRAFEAASGRNLEPFFSQWLTRRGAPNVRIAGARASRNGPAWRVRVMLRQDSPPFAVRLPVVLDGKTTHFLDLTKPESTLTFETTHAPREVALDPEMRVLRRLGPDEAPPILRGVMVAASPSLAVVSNSLRAPAEALARELFDHPAERGRQTTLVVGLHGDVDAWLAREKLSRPREVAGKGTAQVWTVSRRGAPLAIISVRDAAALAALSRPLPHYGAQSYLVFDGAKAIERGIWPSQPQTAHVAVR
ncbi:MAG: ChaN family lipoprotein [Sulfurifustaceae bacterium]